MFVFKSFDCVDCILTQPLFAAPVLLQGRVKLIEKQEGERFKLKARDNNEIDTMFVDKRKKGYTYYHYPPFPSLIFFTFSLVWNSQVDYRNDWFSETFITVMMGHIKYVLNACFRVFIALLTM